MHSYKLTILQSLQAGPKKLVQLTNNSKLNLSCHPQHVARYMRELVEEGYARKVADQYGITAEGLKEIERATSFATSREHCSASQPNWVPPKWEPSRPGANQHRQYRSLGLGLSR